MDKKLDKNIEKIDALTEYVIKNFAEKIKIMEEKKQKIWETLTSEREGWMEGQTKRWMDGLVNSFRLFLYNTSTILFIFWHIWLHVKSKSYFLAINHSWHVSYSIIRPIIMPNVHIEYRSDHTKPTKTGRWRRTYWNKLSDLHNSSSNCIIGQWNSSCSILFSIIEDTINPNEFVE